MPGSVFTLSLPDPLRRHAECRARVAGYGSVAEYIRDLIRTDQRENPIKHDGGEGSPRSSNQRGVPLRPFARDDAFGPRRNRY